MPFDLADGDANSFRQLLVRLSPGLRVAGVDKNHGLASIHPSHHLFGGYSVYRFLSSRISHFLLLMNKTYRTYRTYKSLVGPISLIHTMAISLIARARFNTSRPAHPLRIRVVMLKAFGALSDLVGEVHALVVPGSRDLSGDFAPAQTKGQSERERQAADQSDQQRVDDSLRDADLVKGRDNREADDRVLRQPGEQPGGPDLHLGERAARKSPHEPRDQRTDDDDGQRHDQLRDEKDHTVDDRRDLRHPEQRRGGLNEDQENRPFDQRRDDLRHCPTRARLFDETPDPGPLDRTF